MQAEAPVAVAVRSCGVNTDPLPKAPVQKAAVLKSAGTNTDAVPRVKPVERASLPRVSLALTLVELKAEFNLRQDLIYSKQKIPQASFHKNNKADFISHLKEETIALSQLPEYMYLQNVIELLDDEKNAMEMGVPLDAYRAHKAALREAEIEAAAIRKQEKDEERALNKQKEQEMIAIREQFARDQAARAAAEAREQEKRKALRNIQIAEQQVLHTVKVQCHACLVAPTEKLFTGTHRRSDSHTLTCDKPYPSKCRSSALHAENESRTVFSCEKCDWDICQQCYDFDQIGPAAREKILAEDLRRKEQEARELAIQRRKEQEEWEEIWRKRDEENRRLQQVRDVRAREQRERELQKRIEGFLQGCGKMASIVKDKYGFECTEAVIDPQTDNFNLAKLKKFVVYQAVIGAHKGHAYPEVRYFESSWSTLKQANARACLAFHVYLQIHHSLWGGRDYGDDGHYLNRRSRGEYGTDYDEEGNEVARNMFSDVMELGKFDCDKRGAVKLIMNDFANENYNMKEYRCGVASAEVWDSFENKCETATVNLINDYANHDEDWSEAQEGEEVEEDKEDAMAAHALQEAVETYGGMRVYESGVYQSGSEMTWPSRG